MNLNHDYLASPAPMPDDVLFLHQEYFNKKLFNVTFWNCGGVLVVDVLVEVLHHKYDTTTT